MDDSSLRTVHQLLPSTTLVIPAVTTLVQDWVTSSPKNRTLAACVATHQTLRGQLLGGRHENVILAPPSPANGGK